MGMIALAAVAAIGAVGTYQESQKAAQSAHQQAQAQQQALQAQGRAADVETQRQRIQQVREARIRRAQVMSSAGSDGMGLTGGTSGVTGAVGSINSQMASNIGTINQQQTFAQQATTAYQQAAGFGAQVAQHQARAQQWQTIGNIGSAGFGRMGGWEKLFGGANYTGNNVPGVGSTATIMDKYQF